MQDQVNRYGLPEGYEDSITVTQQFTFSPWDRIKALFGGKLHASVEVLTQFKPGNTQPRNSTTNVRVSWWPRRKPKCYVAPVKPE
uniref:Uncharacterized protein n=1 Tax=viral metagenome TaxID=1070528 RepID=A0A6H1Z998_9ZZZZ